MGKKGNNPLVPKMNLKINNHMMTSAAIKNGKVKRVGERKGREAITTIGSFD